MFAINQTFQEKKKVEFITTLPEKLEAFDKFLGAREWFAGDNISFVDFIMFETLDWMRHLHVESVVKCGNLLAFLKRLLSTVVTCLMPMFRFYDFR